LIRREIILNEMKIDCPVCECKNSMIVITKTENIPYFGEIMESTAKCHDCGYKHSDIMCLEQKESVRYELKIDKSNLNARVIRSQSATVRIPELGLKVEPGPRSQGYVSNVEGVLTRFHDAVITAMNLVQDAQSKENASNILKELEKVKNGENTVTMIIEDPFGHSIIIHEDALKRELTLEEIKNLKTGFTVFENE
jgi:zinc finger protein